MRALCRAAADCLTAPAARPVAADIERAGFSGMLDPDQIGHSLSPAQRQLVEILRALSGPPGHRVRRTDLVALRP